MVKFFKRAWAGAGYLEGFGHHPGWPVLGLFILGAGIAGVQRGGLTGFVGGAVISACALVPFFIAGCVSRAREYEKAVERTFQRLQKDYNG